MKDEALRLALEALGHFEKAGLATLKTIHAITAIREALAEQPAQQPEPCQCPECQVTPHASDCAVHNEPAYPNGACNCRAQPEQEPVAWRNAALRVGEDLCSVGPFGYYDMTAEQWLDWALSVVTVHTPPPQHTWQGLTDEERSYYLQTASNIGWWKASEIIEAKLKAKNGFPQTEKNT